MKKLQACIEKQKVKISRHRECIYRILKENDHCMRVEEILEKAQESSSSKFSLITLYRHLKFFLECDLIIALLSGTKEACYVFKSSKGDCFSICSECKSISKIKVENLPPEMQNSEYICVYKKCSKCI